MWIVVMILGLALVIGGAYKTMEAYDQSTKWWNQPPPIVAKRVLMRGTYIGIYDGKPAYAGQGVMKYTADGKLAGFDFLSEEEFTKMEKELGYDANKSSGLISAMKADKGYGKYNP